MRSGLAQTQALAFLAVLAAASVLAVSGIGAVRSAGPAAQDTATRNSIDSVALAAGDYWLEIGAGEIDLARFCRYLNARFVARGSDIRLRTAAPVGTGGATLPITPALSPDTSRIATGLAQHIAWARDGDTPPPTPTPPSRSPQEANCPVSADDIGRAATSDLLLSGQDLQLPATPITDLTRGVQDWRIGTAGTSGGLGVTRGDMTSAGFSPKTVWVMQPTGFAAGTTGEVPAGTAVGSGPSMLDENAVLIFGAVAPSGNSYCLVKVFDADDREHLGDYRFSHTYNPIRPRIATCTQGVGGGTAIPNGMAFNANWPG